MELYGTAGTLHVPDPNFFGGELRMTDKGSYVTPSVAWDHPLGQPNEGTQANYRCAGLADMAQAILQGRPHRCADDFALHVVDVMTSILRAGETGQVVEIASTCDRPAALDPDAARALLARG